MFLDVYEEYNDDSSKERSQIIHRNYLQNVCVAIMTRPWKAEKLSHNKHSDIHL